MALIKCVECGKKISNSADTCPYCGKLLTEEDKFEGYKDLQDNLAQGKSLSILAITFAFIMPIVGLILGIITITKGLKKKGLLAIILSIVAWLVYILIFIIISGDY